MFKSFFVHENRGPGKLPNRFPRGFTAYIAPNDERTVKLSIAFCSPKDQFCKRTGRDTAQATQPVVMNKREVPQALADAFNKIYGYDSGYGYPESAYLYTLKHMV